MARELTAALHNHGQDVWAVAAGQRRRQRGRFFEAFSSSHRWGQVLVGARHERGRCANGDGYGIVLAVDFADAVLVYPSTRVHAGSDLPAT